MKPNMQKSLANIWSHPGPLYKFAAVSMGTLQGQFILFYKRTFFSEPEVGLLNIQVRLK